MEEALEVEPRDFKSVDSDQKRPEPDKSVIIDIQEAQRVDNSIVL